MGLLRDVRNADLDRFFEHWTDAEANRMAAFTAVDPHAGRGFANARGEEIDETLFRLDA